MPDSTTEAIDRLFDFIDKGVDAADHVFNRGKQTADRHQARRARGAVIDTEATVSNAKKAPACSEGTAIVRKPRFYIVESPHPMTGETIFVVTDGGNARTECSTREFANKVLRALERAL